jgi:hypothetical protein
MPEHEPHVNAARSAEPVHTTVAFEAQDVSVGGVERVGLGLAVTVLVVLAVVAGAFHYLTSEQPLGTPEVAAGMGAGQHPLPPAPRMQGIPGDTVPPPEQQREFQAAAAAELNNYGWVDAEQTIAHIPIGDAMDQLVKDGLPQVAQQSGQQPAAKVKPAAKAASGKQGQ